MWHITKNSQGTPTFYAVVTRDWGSFLAMFGPPIATSTAFVVYLTEVLRGKVPGASVLDVLQFAFLIPISGLIFLPAVLWWYYVIRRTFTIGKAVQGEVIKIDKKFVINIGLTYRYTVDGREVVANADCVNSKTMRKTIQKGHVMVIMDPKRNQRFVRDFFLDPA